MNILTRWSVAVICVVLLCWQVAVQAIQTVDISVEKWASEQLHAKDFNFHLNLTSNGLTASANAKQITLPAPFNTIHDVQLVCPKLILLSQNFACTEGKLAFTQAELGKQNLIISLQGKPENDQYQLDLAGLKLADAEVSINAELDGKDWQGQIKTGLLNSEKLSDWLPRLLDAEQLAQVSQWQYQGRIGLNIEIHGHNTQPSAMQASWSLDQFNFTNQTGTQVGEAITARGKVDLHLNGRTWQWSVDTQLSAGQAYSDPVFLDLAAFPLSLTAAGEWKRESGLLQVDNFSFNQSQVLQLQGKLKLADHEVRELQLSTEPFQLAAVYPVWIQPFSLGTAAANLNTSGQVKAELTSDNQHYALALQSQDVSVADNEKRFSFQGLSGQFGWSSSEQVAETALTWQQAQIYSIDIGPIALKAHSQNNGLQLSEGLDVPVLDGHLLVNGFSLGQTASQKLNWTFDGLLTPISMEALSHALEWPELHGKLSGVIPKVSYQSQQLKVDGALQLKLFDGTTVIRDLRMVTPLGSLPQLYANIDIDNLDLELLTKTFDFGRITGRLDGYVHQLRLSNWQPVQFDASFATPEKNPGKRRISQRAVDNLSQIGGGASGLLSRSFLRFFEDFSYQRLGIKCLLRNETCEMSGIEEAKQGYYIVKGGGGLPPWINVVGYTRRVNWTDLIERLKAVSESSGPVVQ